MALIAVLFLKVQFSPITAAIKTDTQFSTVLLSFDALLKVQRTAENHQYNHSEVLHTETSNLIIKQLTAPQPVSKAG